MVDEIALEGLGNIEDEKMKKYLCYRVLDLPHNVARLKAGCTQRYIEGMLYRKIQKLPNLTENLGKISKLFKDRYTDFAGMTLMDKAQIDMAVLDEMEDDLLLAIKHPRALRRVKETADILGDDIKASGGPTIHVDQIQMMICERFERNLQQDLITGELYPVKDRKQRLKPSNKGDADE